MEEGALPLFAEYVRPDVLLWASDFPHERDARAFGGDIPTLIEREDVSESLKRQIFFDNTCRLYGFDANGENPRRKALAGATA